MLTMNKESKRLIALNRESTVEYPLEIKSKDSFIYQGENHTLSFWSSKEGIDFVELDGISYPVEIVSKFQNEYEVLINGISYSFSIETDFSLQRLKKINLDRAQSTTIRIKAPMPGMILSVLVKTGDIVKAGDTLLILEAMKMQNAILAGVKATVKRVHVKKGETTSKSDLLIELDRAL